MSVVTKTVEASKVRKGALILVEGEIGPRIVTKREKVSATNYRIYHTAVTVEHADIGYGHNVAYAKAGFVFEVYQGENCKLCGKKYMPQFSCYEGFCGYGCSASHAFVTPDAQA